MAQENISRRRFLKRSIWIGAGVGGAALVGSGFYNLLKVNDIRELIGDYPEGAEISTAWPSRERALPSIMPVTRYAPRRGRAC
ncbi:MAG: twin-arginine translocation signal domain-containing protein [Deltaproteobacteria bacterium]|nr:twin-arginine translocation signal domain-containing protein [Deltaproteobacteria bacterium]